MIHPRYKQMLARVRMAVNSMSLPEIRGNPIQAKPVRSTRPEAKAVRLSLPVARARAHVRRIRKSGGEGQELDRVAADLLEPGGWLHAGDIRRQRQAVDAGDEA